MMRRKLLLSFSIINPSLLLFAAEQPIPTHSEVFEALRTQESTINADTHWALKHSQEALPPYFLHLIDMLTKNIQKKYFHVFIPAFSRLTYTPAELPEFERKVNCATEGISGYEKALLLDQLASVPKESFTNELVAMFKKLSKDLEPKRGVEKIIRTLLDLHDLALSSEDFVTFILEISKNTNPNSRIDAIMLATATYPDILEKTKTIIDQAIAAGIDRVVILKALVHINVEDHPSFLRTLQSLIEDIQIPREKNQLCSILSKCDSHYYSELLVDLVDDLNSNLLGEGKKESILLALQNEDLATITNNTVNAFKRVTRNNSNCFFLLRGLCKIPPKALAPFIDDALATDFFSVISEETFFDRISARSEERDWTPSQFEAMIHELRVEARVLGSGGDANLIHEYISIPVATGDSQKVRLNKAIEQKIKALIEEKNLLPFNYHKAVAYLRSIFQPYQSEGVLIDQSIFDWAVACVNDSFLDRPILADTVTLLKALGGRPMLETWLQSFLKESAEAFTRRKRSRGAVDKSCEPGVCERVVTSLRYIEQLPLELKILFAQAESALMIFSKLKIFSDVKYLAVRLQESGITSSSTQHAAFTAFTTIVDRMLEGEESEVVQTALREGKERVKEDFLDGEDGSPGTWTEQYLPALLNLEVEQ